MRFKSILMFTSVSLRKMYKKTSVLPLSSKLLNGHTSSRSQPPSLRILKQERVFSILKLQLYVKKYIENVILVTPEGQLQ